VEIKKNISLAKFSTLRVGGKADFFVRVSNLSKLKEAFKFAESQKIQIFVLGGGSNILFSDSGFRGLVVKNEIGGIEFAENLVRVGAGESLANFVVAAAKNSLAGVENFAGIPGTVGGAVVGNSGGIGEKISRVTIFIHGAEKFLDKNSLEFKYRDSNLRDKIIIEVEFELAQSAKNLTGKITKKILAKIEKQPVENTAGSWFKNPAGKSAWRLIDESGARDSRVGGARVSARHANFFENAGVATAADFFELEKIVAEKVFQKFKIQLDREVIFVPEIL